MKGLFNLGRISTSKAIESDFAKKKIKGMADKYIDQILDIFTSNVSKKKNHGGSLFIHKAIAKLPKPKSGFTLSGHKYTRPYNPLDKKLRHYKDTGEILEIHDKPTGKTDPIAVQHDVDYSVSKDDKKCKNKANRKMVKALDAVPYNERQWGHWLARNMIWRDFTRRRVIVNDVDEMWSADVVDMQKFSKWNKRYKYMLLVI